MVGLSENAAKPVRLRLDYECVSLQPRCTVLGTPCFPLPVRQLDPPMDWLFLGGVEMVILVSEMPCLDLSQLDSPMIGMTLRCRSSTASPRRRRPCMKRSASMSRVEALHEDGFGPRRRPRSLCPTLASTSPGWDDGKFDFSPYSTTPGRLRGRRR